MDPEQEKELEQYFNRLGNGQVRIVPERLKAFINQLLNDEREGIAAHLEQVEADAPDAMTRSVLNATYKHAATIARSHITN